MNYYNIIFDLDGTLTNPVEGILNSLQYALKQMHYSPVPDQVPDAFVGPPLQKSFSELYGFNSKQTERAVELFREYYGKAGLYENKVYTGIPELLDSLSSNGYTLFVATSKYKKYAKVVLEHFELDKYFTDIAAADYSGNHSKEELISSLITNYRLEKDDCVMVGDTLFDLFGAQGAGIDAIALGYGFGIEENLKKENPAFYAESVEDLSDFFFDLMG